MPERSHTQSICSHACKMTGTNALQMLKQRQIFDAVCYGLHNDDHMAESVSVPHFIQQNSLHAQPHDRLALAGGSSLSLAKRRQCAPFQRHPAPFPGGRRPVCMTSAVHPPSSAALCLHTRRQIKVENKVHATGTLCQEYQQHIFWKNQAESLCQPQSSHHIFVTIPFEMNSILCGRRAIHLTICILCTCAIHFSTDSISSSSKLTQATSSSCRRLQTCGTFRLKLL